MLKECVNCGVTKELSEFYLTKMNKKDGHFNECKECTKARVNRNRNRNIDEARTFDYIRQRENFTRIFKHRHRNMRQRVEGRRKDRTYIVYGTKIVTQQEFLEWCRSPETMKQFFRQWIDWHNSDYTRNLTPSIDRIDDMGTYVIGNMRWLPLGQNSILGNMKARRE